MPQVMGSGNMPPPMKKPLPDPRLARVVRDLDRVNRTLDDLHAEVVEVLRDQGVTWDDIGDCYEPTKSRQALQKWMHTRRKRRAGG